MESHFRPQVHDLPLVSPNKNQPGSALAEVVADKFGQMLDEVNSLQIAADKKVEEFATSKEKDIHGTMVAMQKAEISLKLLLQVRAKLTAAYQEVIRTQI